jgi:hypothetical protein
MLDAVRGAACDGAFGGGADGGLIVFVDDREKRRGSSRKPVRGHAENTPGLGRVRNARGFTEIGHPAPDVCYLLREFERRALLPELGDRLFERFPHRNADDYDVESESPLLKRIGRRTSATDVLQADDESHRDAPA